MIRSGILWLLVWPLVIGVSYVLIRLALKKVETKLDEEFPPGDDAEK
ncbi:MAG TPA: hypothetical protein PLK12_13355 [Prolixibacteraceae bacterium]|nr:hypothetical protein [Prolixibacteraceae bacterium]